jgi:hypothetical protein
MLTVSVIGLIPSKSAAQILGLGEWRGFLKSTFEYNREDTESGGSSSSFQGILSITELNLRRRAYIIDPRLVTLSASGDVGLMNGWTMDNGGNETSDEIIFGYDISAYILPDKNLSLSLLADRSQSFFSSRAAARIETVTQNLGGLLSISHLYIPSRISFRSEFRDTDSKSRGVLSQSRTRRNVWRYEGRRGWLNQELFGAYEYVDLTDKIVPSSSSTTHDGNLYYSVDFGTDLNWTWDSLLNFSNISTSTTDQTLITANENLTIQHTDRFQTRYGYNLNRTDAQNGISISHRGDFRLIHRLYDSLTTSVILDGSYSDFPAGRQNSYGGSASFGYIKRLPGGGSLSAGLGGGTEYNSNQFDETGIFVVQEQHTVTTPFALPVALDNPFVVEDSVVVTKIAFGPLPIGCVLPPGPPTQLVLGRDYTLRQVGDVTEIVPISCSGTDPGLNPGDVIAVDYRFIVPRSLTYLESNWNFDLSVDYGWIRPFFRYDQTVDTLLSGEPADFLNDIQSETIGIEFRYNTPRLSANTLGSFRHYASDRTDFNNLQATETAHFRVNPNMSIQMVGTQFFTRHKKPKRDTIGVSLGARVNYYWRHNLSGNAALRTRYFDDSEAPSEFTTDIALELRWLYRQIEVTPRFEFSNRQRDDTSTNEILFRLETIRRF